MRPMAKTSDMRPVHSLYAQLSIVNLAPMPHFNFIREFLINQAAFHNPSSLGCCHRNPPATPLTLLALGLRCDRKILKSRIAPLRSGFFLLSVLTLFVAPFFIAPVNAEQITIATATNFLTTLKELQQPFTRKTGHTLTLVSGSSGALAAQIIHGAPFDVFLSADHIRPNQLIEKGFGDKSTQITYAYGKLALWSLDKTLINPTNGQKVLKTGNFHHIAIANPALAPYGLASLETLRSLGIFFNLNEKIIHGENIAQTFTLLATGSAPLGFVARSQLALPPWNKRGSHWLVPSNLHNKIKQDGLVVSKRKNQPAARQFIQFLKSTPARKIIESFGYGT